MKIVVDVETAIGWPHLWELNVEGIQNLVKVIIYPDHALKPCLLCSVENVGYVSLFVHVIINIQCLLY